MQRAAVDESVNGLSTSTLPPTLANTVLLSAKRVPNRVTTEAERAVTVLGFIAHSVGASSKVTVAPSVVKSAPLLLTSSVNTPSVMPDGAKQLIRLDDCHRADASHVSPL
jgi:hypothetical protein